MSVNGVGPNGSVGGVGIRGVGERREKVLGAVADKLGMSETDLAAELRSGKSLADVAQDHGMSRDDLVATVKDALGNVPNPDAMAGRIIHHKGGVHHRHHGGQGASAPPAPPAPPTPATSQAFDITI